MKIYDCMGDGLARGRAHGEQARDLVREGVERWREATRRPSGSSVEAYAERFIAETRLVAAAQRLEPDLVAEMRGIAQGAGVTESLIFAYNLMDEQWWYDRERDAPGEQPGCTVVGVRSAADGATVLAQNMDLPEWMDGLQVVLRLRGGSTPDALVLSAAGLVGLNGVNRDGVAVCVNTLLMLRHRGDALPVALVVRGVLGCRTHKEACSYLTRVPHASGQHYAVAGPGHLAGFECAANGVAMSACDGVAALAHTNHPLVHTGLDRTLQADLADEGRIENSKVRQRFAESQLGRLGSGAEARRILADDTAPLCVRPLPNRRTLTFASVTFTLGKPPTAEFCRGRPDESSWSEIAWDAHAPNTEVVA